MSVFIKEWSKTPKGELIRKEAVKKFDNSEKGKARRKKWCQSLDGKASKKRYKQSSKGKASQQVSSNKRRTIITVNGDLTTKQWRVRKEEFNYCCAYCKIECLTAKDKVKKTHPQYLTMDHIIPLLDDNKKPLGEHTLANIVPACYDCNCCSKFNKDVWEWLKEENITPSKQLIPILNKATGKRKRYKKPTK